MADTKKGVSIVISAIDNASGKIASVTNGLAKLSRGAKGGGFAGELAGIGDVAQQAEGAMAGLQVQASRAAAPVQGVGRAVAFVTQTLYQMIHAGANAVRVLGQLVTGPYMRIAVLAGMIAGLAAGLAGMVGGVAALQPIVAALGAIITIGSAVAAVFYGLATIIGGVFSKIANLIDKVAGFIAKIGEAVGKLLGMLGELAARAAQVAGIIAAIGIGIGAMIGRYVIRTAAEFENYSARLLTVAGSAQRAGQMLRWAMEFAKTTPYELGEVVDSMVRMQAYGLKPMAGQLLAIGDFAAAMGRRMTDAVEAVADAVMGEWERMKEFGVKRTMVEGFAVRAGIANPFDRMGRVINEAGAQAALFGLIAARSMGGMARMMDTIGGKWSNLKDAISRSAKAMGEELAPTVKRVIDFVRLLVEKYLSPERMEQAGAWIAALFSDANMQRVFSFAAMVITVMRHVGQIAGTALSIVVSAVQSGITTALIAIEGFLNRVTDGINALIGHVNTLLSVASVLSPGLMLALAGAGLPTQIPQIPYTNLQAMVPAVNQFFADPLAGLRDKLNQLTAPFGSEAAKLSAELMRMWQSTKPGGIPPVGDRPQIDGREVQAGMGRGKAPGFIEISDIWREMQLALLKRDDPAVKATKQSNEILADIRTNTAKPAIGVFG